MVVCVIEFSHLMLACWFAKHVLQTCVCAQINHIPSYASGILGAVHHSWQLATSSHTGAGEAGLQDLQKAVKVG